jgi:MerR family transcriptional regulator, aldehyde-responsive regulator
MSINLTEQDVGDLTIQQVSRRTGLAESTLRYYERIGLIDEVPRDERSGHRRYPPGLVAAIEAMSCLRGTGMSVVDMRAYLANVQRGRAGAAEQRELFARHAERLRAEIARLRLRERYVATKAELWAARARGDTATEQRIIPIALDISARLLTEQAGLHHG